MAKVTSSANKQTVLPFSKIQIERKYTEKTDSVDTTKLFKQASTKLSDSTGKSSEKSALSTKDSTSKATVVTIVGIIVGVGLLGVAIWFFYKRYRKAKEVVSIL